VERGMPRGQILSDLMYCLICLVHLVTGGELDGRGFIAILLSCVVVFCWWEFWGRDMHDVGVVFICVSNCIFGSMSARRVRRDELACMVSHRKSTVAVRSLSLSRVISVICFQN